MCFSSSGRKTPADRIPNQKKHAGREQRRMTTNYVSYWKSLSRSLSEMHKTWAMRTGEMSFVFSFPHSIPLLYSAFWCSSLVVRNHGLRIVGAEELKALTRMALMYFSNFPFEVGIDKRYAKVMSQKLICGARVDRKRQRPLLLKFPGQSTLYETLGPLFRRASETCSAGPGRQPQKMRPQPSLCIFTKESAAAPTL